MVGSKIADAAEPMPVSAKSERGLHAFYDFLARELERTARGRSERSGRGRGPSAATAHGSELGRLGYTVSQVVHVYTALCEALTELAQASRISITTAEFVALNHGLDAAIVNALTGFTHRAEREDVGSVKRMGFLVHELRNALAAALVAHSMNKKGVVGAGGSTNALMEKNLYRMRDILDRSFSEVRARNEIAAQREPVSLSKVIDEVVATASEQARQRGMRIEVGGDSQLRVEGDYNYLISALSNLVQNAIKYSKPGGTITVRSYESDKNIVLEVEDQCGGLPKGKAEALFRPFVQKNTDRSGLGLGLTISRQAVAHSGGTLAVRDLPRRGCIFSITFSKQRKPRMAGPRRHAAVAAR